eukprot:snap_masked-scaffold_5-processed-gene-18.36-mRNA-1 protein AED:1.00 eAED:1.00 QI:0/-1/0/0/-1/1/1/0/61
MTINKVVIENTEKRRLYKKSRVARGYSSFNNEPRKTSKIPREQAKSKQDRKIYPNYQTIKP